MPNTEVEAEADDVPAPHLVDATMYWSRSGGGVRRYLLAKRDWLTEEAGWRHTIVAPANDEEDLDDHVDCGGLPLPGSGGYRLPLRRRATSRLIERQAPDLIEVGDPFRLAWAGLDAAQRLGVPSVAFCHSNIAALAARLAGGSRSRDSWARRLAGAYLKRVYGSFDMVLAASDSMVRELREHGVTRAQRQSLGVDCAAFHPARRDPSWRSELGVAHDTRLLLYAGRFAPEKNLPALAAAVRRLGSRYLLVAIGHGPAPPRGRQVLVLPHESDPLRLARALASADAFVHAGDEETFGLAALEAMACGTPVVLRAAGALPELIDGGAGVPVRSNRIDDWAEAITASFAAGRDSWSKAGRARALEHDWGVVMPALQLRYQRLLDGAPLGVRHHRFAFGEVTQPAVSWHAPIGAPRKDLTA